MIHKRHKDPVFISRKKSAELLNVSLNEFHELCILTNTKPVKPKNKQKFDHEDIIFYFICDIQKILDSKVFESLKNQNWVLNKRKQHLKNGRKDKAEKLFDIEHNYIKLIEERFSSFTDAIIGLGDSLDTLSVVKYVFPMLNCFMDLDDVLNNFMGLIKEKNMLSNVFITKKGYYFLITLKKIQILWLHPHKIHNDIITDDFDTNNIRVLFKFAYYHLKLITKKLKSIDGEHYKSNCSIFKDELFYLHTPNEQLSFLIEYMGGTTIKSHTNCHFYVTETDISDFDSNKIYLQPQYIFDCFNQKSKISIADYKVGKKLPKHICPFTKNDSFRIDKKLMLLMSKTKQRLLKEYVKDSKY